MITEDYVSFETAKLLKEKGFDNECSGYYNQERVLQRLSACSIKDTLRSPFYFDCIPAPTLQMAMKWLREEHNIHIAVGIGADVDNPNHIFYAPSIATFIPHKSITYLDEVFEEEEYDTAEQACEAAIRYCLENVVNKKEGTK